jgi:trimethylamine--corrinoid protein Co-methyltransferase
MLLCAGSVEMGKYVRFPISTGGLGAGAKTPGPQASVENTMSAAACGLVGGEVVNGLGVTDFSALLSYEQLMIDHEIAGMIIRLYKGVDVSDETLAADVIKKVGIGGSYLAQRHTMNHIRELYKPLLWEEIVPGLDKPEVDMLQVAKAKAESVLAKHVPAPLDRPVKAEVDRIVASFGKG